MRLVTSPTRSTGSSQCASSSRSATWVGDEPRRGRYVAGRGRSADHDRESAQRAHVARRLPSKEARQTLNLLKLNLIIIHDEIQIIFNRKSQVGPCSPAHFIIKIRRFKISIFSTQKDELWKNRPKFSIVNNWPTFNNIRPILTRFDQHVPTFWRNILAKSCRFCK